MKTRWITEQKSIASSLLTPYDWYIIRNLEESTEIPAEVSKYRDDVRTVCAKREAEINGCIDVTALKARVDGTFTSWPVKPS